MSDGTTQEMPRTRYGDTEMIPFVPEVSVGQSVRPEIRETVGTIVGLILIMLTVGIPFALVMIFGAPEQERVWVDGHYETVHPID